MPSKDTRDTILDVAEELFAEHGFDKTSLREITGRADVNLAAVHYHFGSKEALISAVLERIVSPINEERMRLLDELEARYPEGGYSLEELVAVFIVPPLRTVGKDLGLSARRMELVSHVYADKRPVTRQLLFRQFGEVFHRFHGLFMRVTPEALHEELPWRIHFLVGAMVHTMRSIADPVSPERVMPHMNAEQQSVESLARHLVPFIVAGLRAPSLTEMPFLEELLSRVEAQE